MGAAKAAINTFMLAIVREHNAEGIVASSHRPQRSRGGLKNGRSTCPTRPVAPADARNGRREKLTRDLRRRLDGTPFLEGGTLHLARGLRSHLLIDFIADSHC